MTFEHAMQIWQEGFLPGIEDDGLQRLYQFVKDDSPQLYQGHTTVPLPLKVMLDMSCEGGCMISVCGMAKGATVREVEEYFAQSCLNAQSLMNGAGIHFLLKWFDFTPREEMRKKLLPELEKALTSRGLSV